MKKIEKSEKNKLIEAAKTVRENAYIPYSDFAVGAALLTDEGKIFKGANVENAALGLTCCAERSAIYSAISDGIRDFHALAVIADTPQPASPCGSCRQVLVEFNPDMILIMANLNRIKLFWKILTKK